MAALVYAAFGGMLPALLDRELPDEAAQSARELVPSTMGFRPIKLPTEVSSTILVNPKTLYRMARKADGSFNTNPATGWIIRSGVFRFVKGQIDDDAQEHTYFTDETGATAPKVIDVLGTERQLGVPTPTSAPRLSPTNPEGQYVLGSKFRASISFVLAYGDLTNARIGATHPGTPSTVTGIVDSHPDTAATLANGEYGFQYRVLEMSGGTGNVTNAYGGASDLNNWVWDNTMFLRGVTFNSVSTSDWGGWATVGTAHWCLRIPAYGQRRVLYTAGFSVWLSEIPHPTDPDALLLTSGQVTAIMAELATVQSDMDATASTYASALVLAANACKAYVNTAGGTAAGFLALFDIALSYKQLIDALYAGLSEQIISTVAEYLAANVPDAASLFAGTTGPLTLATRYYVYTEVTDRGEESAPSPVSSRIEMDADGQIAITRDPPPTGRNIVNWRLYRSATGDTSAGFQLQGEYPTTQLTVSDTSRDDELTDSLPTVGWAEPPSNLRGLVGVPNGIMAGFFDNTVCFCEPYHPYAWPVEYQISVEYPVVGLGVFDQTVVVLTRGQPYFMSGSDAASFSAIKRPEQQSCVSARSIATLPGGVIYASPDGLCLASQAGIEVITARHYTKEEWTLLNPSTIFGIVHEGTYYFWHVPANGITQMKALHLGTGKLVSISQHASAAFVDIATDTLYIVSGNFIYSMFTASGTGYTGVWKSKRTVLPAPAQFAWVQVHGEQSESNPVVVNIYDGTTLLDAVACTDSMPQRVAPGYVDEPVIEVFGSTRITKVTLASTTEELAAV